MSSRALLPRWGCGAWVVVMLLVFCGLLRPRIVGSLVHMRWRCARAKSRTWILTGANRMAGGRVLRLRLIGWVQYNHGRDWGGKLRHVVTDQIEKMRAGRDIKEGGKEQFRVLSWTTSEDITSTIDFISPRAPAEC